MAGRVYWYIKEGYGYVSWFFEWLLGVVSAVGIYVVAYEQQIFQRWFWGLVLIAVIISSGYRLQSQRLKAMVKPLTHKQRMFVFSLMAAFTIPVILILSINATNYTGVWV